MNAPKDSLDRSATGKTVENKPDFPPFLSDKRTWEIRNFKIQAVSLEKFFNLKNWALKEEKENPDFRVDSMEYDFNKQELTITDRIRKK